MENKNLITVKEYAQAKGVTEQAVYKRLRNKNSNLQEFLVIENDKKFLKKEVLDLEQDQEEKKVNKKAKEESAAAELEHLKEMVEILKSQLEKTDKQLEEKDTQIKNLNNHIESLNKQNEQLTEVIKTTSNNLNAEQLLHAKTMQVLEAPEEPVEKKGFWSKLFG